MGNRSSQSTAPPSKNRSMFNAFANSVSERISTTSSLSFTDDQPLAVINQPSPPASELVGSDLIVQVKCCCPQVQVNRAKAQEFPCLVSLISPDIAIDNIETNRQGMDLICVIDVSGSMNGVKIQLVKETLNFMLTNLSQKDRVSLITFSSGATRLSPLTVCNDLGKAELGSLVDNIQSGGSTDIVGGLRYGLEVIRQRRQRNPTTALFLLSDGQDDNSDAADRAGAEMAKFSEDTCGGFVTHTFGYGEDHDSEVMSAIARLRKGCYNFVERTETVSEAFAQSLGGLASAFADSISVQVVPNTDTPVPTSLGKVYAAKTDNTVKVINMMISDRKDQVFIIHFPQSPENVISGTKIIPATAVVSYRLIASGEERRQEVPMEVTLMSETEVNPQIDVDETVLVNFYRVKTAEVIKEAGELAERGEYERGTELLSHFLTDIESCLVNANPTVAVLIEDLKKSRSRMHSQEEWSHGGKAMNMDLCSNHMMQQASSNVDVYCNRVQMSYKAASKRKS